MNLLFVILAFIADIFVITIKLRRYAFDFIASPYRDEHKLFCRKSEANRWERGRHKITLSTL